MIAEIHNKISNNGSNLSDRLEDQLTGDFFGTLRYLPFSAGLRQVLLAVRFPGEIAQASSWVQFLNQAKEYECQYKFWFRHSEGEIDLLIEHREVVIGIEVKYFSGLSSDDDDDDEDPEHMITAEDSRQQLARYSRLLNELRGARPAYLVFLAPFQTLAQVEQNMQGRALIWPEITLGFLAWQHVLEQLQAMDPAPLETGQQIILEDLKRLLVKKGFQRFRGFQSAGNAEVCAEEAYHYRAEYTRQEWKWEWPLDEVKEDYYVYGR